MTSASFPSSRSESTLHARDRSWWKRAVITRLSALRGGSIQLVDDRESITLGDGDPVARVRVATPRFYRRLAIGGTVGAGEAYVDGDWDCDGLVDLVRLMVRNRDLTDRMETGIARLPGLVARAVHRVARDNSESGSRSNIAAHYDLGNALFESFLDSRMQYSSAWYDDDVDLEAASSAKLQRIAAKLDLGPHDHLLEIGTGWGGLAIHAAQHAGCRVTTTTISAEQYAYAVDKVRAAGCADRVTVRNDDYRSLRGRYSKIVSVEMVEAVGAPYLDGYFGRISSLLTDDGIALLQAITIEDHRYQEALSSVDFIKKHVFPGSFIPAVSVLIEAAARAKLTTVNLEDLGFDYAETLKAWRERFETNWPAIAGHGYDERFRRLWRFYLAYCEGGFRERALSDVQILFAKPGYRARPFRGRA